MTLGLHDIPDPAPLLPGVSVPFWAWMLAAAVVGALAAGAMLALRHRGRPAPEEDTFFAEAHDALRQLQDHHDNRHLAEVATDASLIVRGYLALALNEPALFETHEEFVMRSDALDTLPDGARRRLIPLLTNLAAAKYGPSAANDEAASTLIQNCLDVLRGLESTRERCVA